MKKARLLDIAILVVDDEPMLCEVLSDLFQAEGAAVTIATGAFQALDIFKTNKFQILLSDVRMPNGDGPHLVRSLTPDQKLGLHIYFCSGYNDLSSEQLDDLGVISLFSKPFDFDKIVDKIVETYNK